MQNLRAISSFQQNEAVIIISQDWFIVKVTMHTTHHDFRIHGRASQMGTTPRTDLGSAKSNWVLTQIRLGIDSGPFFAGSVAFA
jgi:hypothetical protein